jgi:Leucine-rich repeat (LRR) protein
MKQLASSPSITSVWLCYNPRISDQGIKNLNPKNSPLRALFLNRCNVTDGAAPDLAKFRYMFSIDLEGNPKISDRTILALDTKTNELQCLDLANDKIGDAGIHALTHFKALRILDLSGVRLSPSALADLATMKNLTNLYLVGCNLSTYEVGKLTKALPSTMIENNNRVRARLL